MAKANKQRFCPVVSREITSAECGANRISRYACPADCSFNPFAPANYSMYLAVERRADERAMDWLKDHALDRAEWERQAVRALQSSSMAEINAVLAWQLLFKRDAAGQTCAQRWRATNFSGLNNDERIVLGGKAQARVCLLEVHRIFDTPASEVVDLFAPEAGPFRVMDRGVSASMGRFSSLLAIVYPLPCYSRLVGGAIHVREMGSLEPLEIVRELAAHLGGPTELAPLQQWLAEHFMHFAKALGATAHACLEQMFAAADAVSGKAVYEVRAPLAECRARLDATPGLLTETPSPQERSEGFFQARVWLDGGAAPASLPARAHNVLGRVLLGQIHWRVEALGAERLARLRQCVEGCLGHRLHFVAERRDDLHPQLGVSRSDFDRRLVPPRLLETAEKLVLQSTVEPVEPGEPVPNRSAAELAASQLQTFPDTPLPALDGRTPRQAATDPAWRPRLVRLLKSQVRRTDELNLREGQTTDINWLLRDLGMNEILFDPPPPRPAQPE